MNTVREAVGVRVVAIIPSDGGNYLAGHMGVVTRLGNLDKQWVIVRWDHSGEEHTSKCAKLNTNSMQRGIDLQQLADGRVTWDIDGVPQDAMAAIEQELEAAFQLSGLHPRTPPGLTAEQTQRRNDQYEPNLARDDQLQTPTSVNFEANGKSYTIDFSEGHWVEPIYPWYCGTGDICVNVYFKQRRRDNPSLSRSVHRYEDLESGQFSWTLW
jgi:hypothetical protein